MNQFFTISSQHPEAQAVIDDCLRQLKARPADANFAFIYISDAMSAEFTGLIEQCKTASGIKHWLGTLGTAIIADDKELYDQPAVSIMLASFDDDDFTFVPSISSPDDITSHIQWPRQFATNFGIIHGDPFNPMAQQLIEDLQTEVDNGFIVGGISSSQDKHYQLAGGIMSGGISGVLFSENISVLTNLSQGCSPAGKKHRVTRAQENAAFTLDNKPALETLMHDMAINDYTQLQENAAEVFVGLCIPGSDRSDYTVRNIVGFDIDHSIFAINDYLTDESELIFCKRNQQTAIDDMQHMLDNLADRLKQKPKGGIYISCLGRGREQFGDDSEEVKMIRETLGDFPLTGFFASGEIHHGKLYGYTGVLTLFI